MLPRHFRRIGQHLELGSKAKGNALKRNLERAGIAPRACKFEMLAIGPIFPEQEDMANRCVYLSTLGSPLPLLGKNEIVVRKV